MHDLGSHKCDAVMFLELPVIYLWNVSTINWSDFLSLILVTWLVLEVN